MEYVRCRHAQLCLFYCAANEQAAILTAQLSPLLLLHHVCLLKLSILSSSGHVGFLPQMISQVHFIIHGNYDVLFLASISNLARFFLFPLHQSNPNRRGPNPAFFAPFKNYWAMRLASPLCVFVCVCLSCDCCHCRPCCLVT